MAKKKIKEEEIAPKDVVKKEDEIEKTKKTVKKAKKKKDEDKPLPKEIVKEPETIEETPVEKKKKKKYLLITLFCFVVIGIILFLYWFIILRFEEYTDDAYVHGNIVELTPQIQGTVTTINVIETNCVRENQILVELDDTDYKIALDKAKAELGQMVREVSQMFQNAAKLLLEISINETNLLQANQDYNHRVHLIKEGGVSIEDFEHVENSLNNAKLELETSKKAYLEAFALIDNTTIATHPLVMQANEKLKQAWVNLNRCKIRAPTDGFISKRAVQVGNSVDPNDPLLAIIPLNDLWVEANYKEIKLAKMRIGQKVKVISDIYGRSVVFRGKIVGLDSGTGSAFSLLPPQNATGNWIKIVQRLPVRISLDPKQLKKYPLRIGLSLKTTVDIHDTKGKILTSPKRLKPIYKTYVYKQQEEGAAEVIDKIIKDNITY
jgi:membrane fusion protein, multidrug efflux system